MREAWCSRCQDVVREWSWCQHAESVHVFTDVEVTRSGLIAEIQEAYADSNWDRLRRAKWSLDALKRDYFTEQRTETPWFSRHEVGRAELCALDDPEQEFPANFADEPEQPWYTLPVDTLVPTDAQMERDPELKRRNCVQNWDHLKAEKQARIDLYEQLAARIAAARHSTPRDLYKVTQQVRKQLRVLPWTKRGNVTRYNLALTKPQKAELNAMLDAAWKESRQRKAA